MNGNSRDFNNLYGCLLKAKPNTRIFVARIELKLYFGFGRDFETKILG